MLANLLFAGHDASWEWDYNKKARTCQRILARRILAIITMRNLLQRQRRSAFVFLNILSQGTNLNRLLCRDAAILSRTGVPQTAPQAGCVVRTALQWRRFANRVMAVERGRGDKFAKIVRRRLEALTQNHRMETNVLEVMG